MNFNEPIDALAVAQLQPGTSTARQVVDLLGGPVEVVQLGRRTAYLYSASTQKSANLWAMALALSNTDTRQDRVWVFFDEGDVLTHVGATVETKVKGRKLPCIRNGTDARPKAWGEHSSWHAFDCRCRLF